MLAAFSLFLLTLTAEQTGSLSGHVVVSGDATPVRGAVVSVRRSQTRARRITASDGRFDFDNLPAGHYEVSVIATGFEMFEKRIEVKTGAGTALDVKLVREGCAKLNQVCERLRCCGGLKCVIAREGRSEETQFVCKPAPR